MDNFSATRVNHMKQFSSVKHKKILLCHHRLWHPPFNYLKHFLKCDTCILAKSHCVSCHSNSNKNDCTLMIWLCVMKHKNKTQFSATVRILYTNTRREYINQEFHHYFQTHGIIHETTCPQTLLQNGVAKRNNQHILETTRALLIGSHVPCHFWVDVIITTIYLLN
ncbi:hypothetical protein CR513_12948, partial [Mucuna pruriens]